MRLDISSKDGYIYMDVHPWPRCGLGDLYHLFPGTLGQNFVVVIAIAIRIALYTALVVLPDNGGIPLIVNLQFVGVLRYPTGCVQQLPD